MVECVLYFLQIPKNQLTMNDEGFNTYERIQLKYFIERTNCVSTKVYYESFYEIKDCHSCEGDCKRKDLEKTPKSRFKPRWV
jgi:hypothetical protein